ncbi:MAG: glutamine--tRNA ligase/YqeY domain fusion protein [Elusimicrobiota bacterium]
MTSENNFIKEIIDSDLESGRYGKKVATRFPPEPNGYLHIGHAKSICLNFGIAREYGGSCYLRFDDTNPVKEEKKYIDSIKRDTGWLGFSWGEKEFYASDYFKQMYEYALQLIKKGKAYVDDLSPEEIRSYRGTLKEPGKDSPFRNRSVEENLTLFKKMKEGEFADGEKVLRAKIDMSSPNINMRDPVMYRILKASHPRTAEKWKIYPMYDFAHCLEDSIERITHSICTLEFEDHRPLYDWFLSQLDIHHPRQIEFARLNLSYTVLSKRKLSRLVQEGHVDGWDDPRMPTISGFRRRGYTPDSIKDFASRIGVAKANSVVDIALLEHCIREELNKTADRVFAVLDPLKVVISNYPENKTEYFEVENNPENPGGKKRKLPFKRELYIEKADFMEDPPKKFFRLAPGRESRLKSAYYIKCNEVIKDSESGEIKELRCTYDPESKGGGTADRRKVSGTLHWVCADDSINVCVRNYDRLFNRENPNEADDFTRSLNPDSLSINNKCIAETSLKEIKPGKRVQFFRHGYYIADTKDSRPGVPVFNRITPLKDTWARIKKRQNS